MRHRTSRSSKRVGLDLDWKKMLRRRALDAAKHCGKE
jgi:hypothetical protein